MRRREHLAARDLPVVPPALRRFRLHDWREPSIDPPPEPWEPYATAEDRFLFHAVRAIGRWKSARHAWEVEQGLPLREVLPLRELLEARLAVARPLQEMNADLGDPRWEVSDAP